MDDVYPSFWNEICMNDRIENRKREILRLKCLLLDMEEGYLKTNIDPDVVKEALTDSEECLKKLQSASSLTH